MGEWVQKNGDAIYGTDPSPFGSELPQGPVTITRGSEPGAGKKLYFMLHHLKEVSNHTLTVNGICGGVKRAVVLGQDQPLALRQYPAAQTEGDAPRDMALQQPLTCLLYTSYGKAGLPRAMVAYMDMPQPAAHGLVDCLHTLSGQDRLLEI